MIFVGLLVLLVLVGSLEMFNLCGADPTEGFTPVTLAESILSNRNYMTYHSSNGTVLLMGFTDYGSIPMTSHIIPIVIPNHGLKLE